jgi:hypothetical protein
MSRPNTFRVLIFPVLLLIFAMTACSGSAEEQTFFNKYFLSSKIADNLTLSNIATVAFDPAVDGQMVSFSITQVGEEKIAPLTLKAGAEDVRKAVAAESEFTKSKKAFQDANDAAIERVLKAEAKGQKLGGKDLEVQKAWTKWRDDAKAMAQKVSAVRKAGNENRPVCRDQPHRFAKPGGRHGLRRRNLQQGHHHRRQSQAADRRHRDQDVHLHDAARDAEERQWERQGRPVGHHGPQGSRKVRSRREDTRRTPQQWRIWGGHPRVPPHSLF